MLYTPECGICKRYKKKMAKKWSEDPTYKDITFLQGNGSKLKRLAVSFRNSISFIILLIYLVAFQVPP